MSITIEWIVLDTNIWIFGLRNQANEPACYQLLQYLNKLYVKTPYQIFLELQANLNRKFQAPKSKFQINFKFQITNI